MYKKITSKLNALLILMRVDKPIGIFLLLWPTLTAFFILTEGNPRLDLLAIFIIGTVLMRSAGCVINDYFDREVDARVKRTRDRPLVTGKISPKEALILFFILITASASLLFFMNLFTFFIALTGTLITIIYPLTKRFFSIPQFFLGFAFSWGIVMASAAELNAITEAAYLMFFACFFWILAYDTIYALCDKEDDKLIGVKSSALAFGSKVRYFILTFHLLSLATWIYTGFTEQLNWSFYFCSLGVLPLIVYQMYLIKDYDKDKCLKAFKNNNWVGLILLTGSVIGTL